MENSLKNILNDQPLDDYLLRAIHKADVQRSVRDRLSGLEKRNALLWTRDKKLHFQMLGRVGYDRVEISDITSVESQKQKGSFKLNEIIRNDIGMFSIKDVFVSTIKIIEEEKWLDTETKTALKAVLLSELATKWFQIQQKLSAKQGPTKNTQFIRALFAKIQEKLGLVLDKTYLKQSKWIHNNVFDKEQNNERLKAYFRLQVRVLINIEKLSKNLSFNNFQTQVRKRVLTLGDTKLSVEESTKHEIDQAIGNATNHLEDVLSNIKKNSNLNPNRQISGLKPDKNNTYAFTMSKANSENHVLDKDIELDVTSNSSDDDMDIEFSLGFDTILSNPILCANIRNNGIDQGTIADQMELESYISKAKRLLYDDRFPPKSASTRISQESKLGVLSTSEFEDSESVKLPSNMESTIDFKSICETADAELGSSHDIFHENMKNDPLFINLLVSPDLFLPVAVSMASERVPKDMVKLSLQNNFINIYECANFKDRQFSDIKDTGIIETKSMREVYNRYFSSFDKNGFTPDDDMIESSGFPAAPKALKHMTVNTLKQANSFTVDYLEMKRHEFDTNPEPREKKGHEIRKIIRDPQIGAIVMAKEFSRNRAGAMKKVMSSKYGILQYNFGGYIPHELIEKDVKNVDEILAVHDYLSYLNGGQCDFLLDIIIAQRAESLQKQRQFEELEKESEKAKNKKLMRDKAIAEKLQRRRAMTEFIPGKWNLGVLDLIEEVHYRDTIQIAHWKKLKDRRVSGKVYKLEYARSKSVKLFSSEPSTLELEELSGVRTDSMTDLVVVQKELEDVWEALKMPLDMRVDMVIKYSSTTSGYKAELAAEMWKNAALKVVEREEILRKIEKFELHNSDPKRFFAFGSSNARIKEVRQRTSLLNELHHLEIKLKEIMKHIEKTQHEVVTYNGIPMKLKLQRDYIDIMRRTQNQRKKLVAHDRRGSV